MNKANKILLVEDDPRDEELTLTTMEKYHVSNDIFVVHDGEEALDYLFRRGRYRDISPGNPSLILLDLNLPKMRGEEVLRQIRADEKLRMIPVVVLTSSREDKDMAEAYRIGINAYVVKPVDFHEFVEVVKNLAIFWCMTNEPPPGSIGKVL